MSKTPPIGELWTATGAALEAGVNRRTLQSAIERGEVVVYRSACGRAGLVRLEDVKVWARVERRPGRRRVETENQLSEG